eukprot:361067-Prymnesium_polylepis.1
MSERHEEGPLVAPYTIRWCTAAMSTSGAKRKSSPDDTGSGHGPKHFRSRRGRCSSSARPRGPPPARRCPPRPPHPSRPPPPERPRQAAARRRAVSQARSSHSERPAPQSAPSALRRECSATGAATLAGSVAPRRMPPRCRARSRSTRPARASAWPTRAVDSERARHGGSRRRGRARSP